MPESRSSMVAIPILSWSTPRDDSPSRSTSPLIVCRQAAVGSILTRRSEGPSRDGSTSRPTVRKAGLPYVGVIAGRRWTSGLIRQSWPARCSGSWPCGSRFVWMEVQATSPMRLRLRTCSAQAVVFSLPGTGRSAPLGSSLRSTRRFGAPRPPSESASRPAGRRRRQGGPAGTMRPPAGPSAPFLKSSSAGGCGTSRPGSLGWLCSTILTPTSRCRETCSQVRMMSNGRKHHRTADPGCSARSGEESASTRSLSRSKIGTARTRRVPTPRFQVSRA